MNQPSAQDTADLPAGPILVTLLPITLLPWIVQRRRNTWVGIIIHAVFNGTGFIVVTSSLRAQQD